MDITGYLQRLTLPELVTTAAERFGNSAAVSADDGERSFRSLAIDVQRFGAGLSAQGVLPGDRVAVVLPNGIRWLVAVLGAQAAGAVAVPLNTWYTATELHEAIELVQPVMVVATQRALGRDLEALVAEAVAPADGRRESPPTTVFWSSGESLPQSFGVPTATDMAVLARRSAEVAEADDAYLLFTSGSSAKPKAVRLLHHDIIRNGRAIAERQKFRRGERLWIASPLFFSMGAVNALASAYCTGVELCIEERYEPERSLDLLEQKACAIYYGLPAITESLLGSPSFPERRLALRTGIGAMTSEEKSTAIERLGVKELCSVYGLTEAYTLVAMTDLSDPVSVRLATQGYPLPTQEMRIAAGPDVAPDGQLGEIEVRGCVTPGYFGGLSAPITPDGWLKTGDRGRIDSMGRLIYEGRISDVVKTNGILVAPAEIEARLVGYPLVSHALVFGLPDEARGEVLAGLIVLRAPSLDRNLGALRRGLDGALSKTLASYKRPRYLWFCEEADLPLTATGKYDKRAIQRAAIYEGWHERDGQRVTPSRGVALSDLL